MEVADGEVRQVVGALVRPQQVGGQQGVAGHADEVPPAGPAGQRRPLRAVHGLGPGRVGQPVGERRVGRGRQVGGVDVGAGAVGGGQRDAGHVAGAAPPVADELGGGQRARVLGQPARDRRRLQPLPRHLEGRGRDGLRRGKLKEPLAQHAELQGVEQGVHPLAVPVLARGLVDGEVEGQVAQEPVQPPVADDVVEMRPQRLARLAGHLLGAGHEVVEAIELRQPLRGGLGADAGDAGQVVAGLPHQGRELGVARGGDEILRLDRLRRHAREVGDAPQGVEHGDAVVDELQRVAVAGDDEHLEALRLGLGGEGADEVVGLVAGQLDVGDPQRVEDLLDEGHLPLELLGRRRPLGLVLGVLLGAEGRAGDVERDGQVRGPLVAQDVDEHRGEAEHRVGVLPRAGGEVLHREREERAVRHRVAIDQQQLARVIHAAEPTQSGHDTTGLRVPDVAECPP